MKALHFKANRIHAEFFDAVRQIPSLELDVVDEWESLSDEQLAGLIRQYDVLLLSRQPRVPDAIADDPGRLKYISYLHGGVSKAVGLPIIRSSIQVTNWGDRVAGEQALNSITLLLATVRDLHARIAGVRRGEKPGFRSVGEHVAELNIGVYGFGAVAREFVRLLEPFGATIRVYDPYAADIPVHCTRVDSLKALFETSRAIVIHAGLTPETKGSVTRELLALLPDHGIVINTARGAIVDQEALFDELRNGRLRAGLDVLWPDNLPGDHEARQWENLIWTCHRIKGSAWPDEGLAGILRPYRNSLENLEAFVKGQPLKWIIDEKRYESMT
jgi:phosphoglycerate dehydrogenase-like enzyme